MSSNDGNQAGKDNAVQHVFKVRRDYNTWVANETLEDYALRFTPRNYRKWSEFQVANTAFSSASFLVLEAIGATLLVNYGFINAAFAIFATALIIFLASLPLSRYSARYGLDMDLLTRGSGFGYLGSTITSLIYAAFTFIFFALEAAIMASALKLAFGIPVAWGYLICALVVVPLVTRGITAISRLQTMTQPIWLAMLLLPYFYLLVLKPQEAAGLIGYGGRDGSSFDIRLFGAAVTVAMAIIAQMGEQADYLRFMPELTYGNRRRWHFGVLLGGTGWLLLSAVKMLGGAMLAYLAIRHFVPENLAVNPNQMYLTAYRYVFPNSGWAVVATAAFVIISQLKINVTNAYAGSLAWSNFFSRLTHSHPGRVVWVVFNTLIALMLMELDLLQVMGKVLGLYSNVAVAWMMAVVADLVINKPLGFSPPGIEFRRAYLYDINPVGFGAMGISTALSISVYLGIFGPDAQPFAIFISLGLPLALSPLFAWITGGKYYIARQPEPAMATEHSCCICSTNFESEDMSACPAYQGSICSLCCTLDARCHDLCKPQARLTEQWAGFLGRFFPASLRPYLDAGVGHYMLLMGGFTILIGLIVGLLYYQERLALNGTDTVLVAHLQDVFIRISSALLLLSGIIAWWMVLTSKSRQVAQEEANYQTQLLMQEINSHHHTDQLLQRAKVTADQANQAKSRYIMSISHELRTPLNSILGYAQILDGDEAIPANRRQAISVIRRSGDHLLSLIEGTLDIARIEGGKVSLAVKPLHFPDFVQQIVEMFELQAHNKGIDFDYRPVGELPSLVRADASRLRQILINILGNAVKFTARGGVIFHLKYQSEMATFEIEDTGPGIAQEELEHIFEPFSRGSATHIGATGGTGLGLTIAKMLTDLMGGELTVESSPGKGSCFRIRLFLPHIQVVQADQAPPRAKCIGYIGVRRRILIVDNEKTDRDLLASVLEPLGFRLAQAASGQECLDLVPMFIPHLIFMDLAMPGIDGWETIRRLRQCGFDDCEIAVISANAFEKGTDNEAGIAPENFITKPVNVNELLDWIGQHLGLEWVTVEGDSTKAGAPTPPTRLQLPSGEYLRSLEEQIELGYVRGILKKLDEIEQIDVAYFEFADNMRQLAHQFQFDTMKGILHRGLCEDSHGTY
ncbi:MAG: response regulator [Burkholderiales bacterium]|nr:response regulator [Burkholderiales bacterium]